MQRVFVIAILACLLTGSDTRTALAQDPLDELTNLLNKHKRSTKHAPKTPLDSPQLPVKGTKEFVVAEPVGHLNLAIFPIVSAIPVEHDRFVTLDEGFKAGTVQVFEVGAEPRQSRETGQAGAHGDQSAAVEEQGSADVNQLMVLNSAKKPLYIMPGEIIYGGQQDRAIQDEAIIQPGEKAVAVKVFCVEQGRWASRSDEEMAGAIERLGTSAGQALDAASRRRLVNEAKLGKFVAPAGSLNKSGRLAVQVSRNQGEVWDKVHQANTTSGVASDSSAFTANYTDSKVLKQLDAFTQVIQAPVASQKQAVGAVVVINGRVEEMDVFESTPLFLKQWPKLLRSYALDAVLSGKADAAKICSTKEAIRFMDAAMQASVKAKYKYKGYGGLVITARESEEMVLLSVSEHDSAAGSLPSGFSAGIHSACYAK